MLGMLVTLGAARYMWGWDRYTYRDPRTGDVYAHSADDRDPWKEIWVPRNDGSDKFKEIKPMVSRTKLAYRLRMPLLAAAAAFTFHAVAAEHVPMYRDWDKAWDKYGLEIATNALDLPKPPQNFDELKERLGIGSPRP